MLEPPLLRTLSFCKTHSRARSQNPSILYRFQAVFTPKWRKSSAAMILTELLLKRVLDVPFALRGSAPPKKHACFRRCCVEFFLVCPLWLLETALKKVLGRVLRRCLAGSLMGGRAPRMVLRRCPGKGLSRRHVEGRKTSFSRVRKFFKNLEYFFESFREASHHFREVSACFGEVSA